MNVVVDFLQDSDDCNTGRAQRIHEGFKSTFYVGAGWPRPLVVTVVRTLSLTYVKIQMFVTRGRTRRSAPTRRFCIRQAGSICYSVAMSGRIRQAERVFVAIRKAFSNRNAREGTAALPYAEMLHPTGRQYSLQRRHEREDTASGVCVASPSHSRRKSWISRCAVECGVGGPLAGLVSYRILQASTYSAAGRAGTIDDGQNQHIVTK